MQLQSLIQKQYHRLFRLARWLLHSDEEAEEVLQNLFLKFWRKGQDFSLPKSPDAWLTRVVRNACIDHQRAASAHHHSTLEVATPSQKPSPHRQLEARDTYAKVLELIRGLPDPYGTVIQLRHVEEKSVREIALHLEYSENHVRVCLSRARKMLKQGYQENHHVPK